MQQRLIFLHSIMWPVMLILFSAQAYADVTVDASLSHSSIPLGRAAKLTVTVNGASRSADVQLPNVQGVRFHNRGQSSRINMINGKISSSISSEYLVQPLQTGTFTIAPIEVAVSGKIYKTKAINFESIASSSQANTKNNTTPDTGERTDEAVFIRVSKTGEHYPGEIVPIILKAYFDQQYRADIQSLPTLQGDGVVMSHLEEKPRQTQESLGGKMYNVLTWETALSGIKVGKHPVTFALDASLLIPQKRRSLSTFGGSSLFNDTFFNSMFDDYQRKPISAVSPDTTFSVLPLPTEKQPGDGSFTGAIGDFALNVTASPLIAEVGEPITLTMEVSGQGNFDRVESPVFPASPDWKTYSPNANFTSQGNTHTGSKIFEQAIVAKNDTVLEIPSLSFCYFDPEKKAYITRTSKPISITLQKSGKRPATVLPRVELPQQQNAPLTESPEGIQGLAPIHITTGSFSQDITPLFQRMWFMALCAVLILILLGVNIYTGRQRKLAQHPEIVLKQRQNQILVSDLEKIHQAQNADDSIAFLSSCRMAIQNQLGPLWSMEPSAISLTDLTTRLKAGSGLIEIFEAAEQAAYGAATLSHDTMAAYSTTVARELEVLQ